MGPLEVIEVGGQYFVYLPYAISYIFTTKDRALVQYFVDNYQYV